MTALTASALTTARFPHPTRAVALRETHISWVVLTGDYAYKIKKALQLEFIDTASLERRQALCQEEIRLNQRYAPALYVDVVPITCEAGSLCFGGEGVPIEFAVRMQQFNPREELQSLLDRRTVEPPEIAALAERIAEFHRAAAVFETGSGTRTFVRKARENIQSVIERAKSIDFAPACADLHRWSEAKLARHSPHFHTREQHGFMRECHGDLHSGNVVRWRNNLIPFDCIEFDPELRFIDVLNDVAFLVMDLIARARSDLAFVFLNRYLERTGDYSGAELMPCYLVYRALIRAKVTLIALEQHAQVADAHRHAVSSLLSIAVGFTRSKPPLLIVMHGASGSGKSWLSERLVPSLPAVRIRSDLERKRLAGIDPLAPHTSGMNEGIYTRDFNDRTYAHLLDCARACLRGKMNTIVDAAFLKLEERHAFAALAAQEKTAFLIVSCGADRDTLAARIERRRSARSDPSDADLDVLNFQLSSMEPLTDGEASYTLHVDTRSPDVERTVLEHLAIQTS